MTETNFESILDKSLDEITAPANVPTGPWLVRGVGYSTKMQDDKDNPGNKLEVFSLGYEPVEAGADVDPEAIAKGDWQGKRLWHQRWVRDRNDSYRFKTFLALHGIDTSGRTVREALDSAFKGSVIHANVGLRSYEKDGATVTDNTIKDFAAAA